MSRRGLSLAACHLKYIVPSRSFSASATAASGHSRWSKIKHDKGKTDASKSGVRQDLARALTLASKNGGADPTFNAHLPGLIANAKRSGMPKTLIDAAIARGQGVSLTGQALESVNVEFLFPESNIAGIMECQTENKNRLMQTVNVALKAAGATNTAVSFMFDKKGKIVFDKQNDWDEESVMDKAIEAGASDVDMDEEETIVFTEPSDLASVAGAMSTLLGSKPKSQDLVWLPKGDMTVNSQSITQELQDQIDKIWSKMEEGNQSIQEVHLNVV